MSNKKVALISLYSDDVKGIPPLALLYLATALKKNGHQAKIIHKNASESGAVIKEVKDCQPDLVGMSVFTGYHNKKYVELSRFFKNKGYKIIWGNAHPSLLPEQVLQEPSVDFVAIGEGEETLVDLLNKIDDEEKYSTIPGLGFKNKEGQAVINARRDFIGLDDYLIDWSLIDLEKYLLPYFSNKYKRTLILTTSRGCPYNCQFCYNLVFNKRKWRCHSVEKLVASLKPVIEEFKVDAIRFLDDNFFIDKDRAFKIVRELNLPYYASARVEYVDEEFVKNLKATNCQEIAFGFESGSDRILKEVIQKGMTTQNIVKAITLLKDSKIMTSGAIIFGVPSETKEEYHQTMKFIANLLEINNNLAFTCGWFLPFAGTGLYEKAKRCGFRPPVKTEDWDKFNRWSSSYTMEWLDWDYQKAVKYSRRFIHLLALAYKRNIPIFKTTLKKRVENLNFSFPLDIYILSRLRNIYLFSGDKNFVYRLIRRIIMNIIKIKQRV
ncbi:B12-binding domain-containing radical SAM protein [Patescibacteria group bacterium]|nr:B12-binding domain-containing radical SAM protein [Patescibacteria group bacterium]